jgi:type IV secretory pathway VirB2 component (pilin)
MGDHEVKVGAVVPSIEAVQTDIGFGNQYRLELIKTSLAVATGLLAFTVTFRPSVAEPSSEWLMWIGWIGLGLSALGAMGNMYGWERFYISYRDQKSNVGKGERIRKTITFWRRIAMAIQFAGFAVGVLGIAVFAAINLDHAKVPA